MTAIVIVDVLCNVVWIVGFVLVLLSFRKKRDARVDARTGAKILEFGLAYRAAALFGALQLATIPYTRAMRSGGAIDWSLVAIVGVVVSAVLVAVAFAWRFRVLVHAD